MGVLSNATEFHWLTPIIHSLPIIDDNEEDNDIEDTEPLLKVLPPPEQVQLYDVLDGRDYEGDEDINEDCEVTLTVKLQWNPPNDLTVDEIDISTNSDVDGDIAE
ncbi:hypothetical protein J3R83DRAFT_3199 [Lanmaoa asiatica]|nr:hypothetical protein J3R83DRAFT_3199 [Lanmaoa asiatica]